MKLRKFESKSKIRGKGKYLKARDSNVAVRLFKLIVNRIPSFATKSIFQTGNPPIISEIVLRVWNYL